MRAIVMIIVFGALLALPPALASDDECDMKTVEKAFVCEDHDILTAAELVSDVTYYVCDECDVVSKTAGECELCGEPMRKKTSGKGVCPHCFAKPMACEACVKIYYVCPDCDATSAKPGKCGECDVDLEKVVSRELIEYVCPECGETSLVPGKCGDAECEHHGKPLVRRCAGAGTFPHVKSGS